MKKRSREFFETPKTPARMHFIGGAKTERKYRKLLGIKAKPKPAFRIEIKYGWYPSLRGRYVKRWTWGVASVNGKNVLSSTSQLYSRRADAVSVARRFLAAAKAGRVEIARAKSDTP